MQEIDLLYYELDTDNRVKFRELYKARYFEVLLWIKSGFNKRVKIPDEDTVDQLVEMYITGILSEPNEVTHYAYDAEVYRKRDRAKEAINAVSGSVQKQEELDRALRYWTRQTLFYCDIVSDAANIQAMKDAGVKKVMWNTQKDEKVCGDCHDRDGVVYPIDQVPDKAHPGCRCWLTPVK